LNHNNQNQNIMDKKEQDLISALRAKISSIDPKRKGTAWLLTQTPDSLLARFLRGNKYDVEFAFEKLCETAKWRFEMGIDELMKRAEKDESPSTILIRGHWPRGITGKDKTGKPVIYNHLTAVDFPGLVNAVGMDDIELQTIITMEQQLRENPQGMSIMIMDLGLESMDVSFSEIRHWISTMVTYIKRVSTITDFYPEMYSKIVFTRPPKLFYGTFKVTKTFLPERTLEKIKVLSGDCLSTLLEDMDIESIPDVLGGKSPVVIGLGGFLPKNVLQDQKYMSELAQRVKLMTGETKTGNKERFSLIRSAKDEAVLQEKLALELLKEQIEMAKHKSAGADKRGSWHFEAGLDVLDDTPDEVLIKELEDTDFDPQKALAKLKAAAAAKSGIKVPINHNKSSPSANGVEDSDKDKKDKSKGDKECVVM
jgi:hypothetical protein